MKRAVILAICAVLVMGSMAPAATVTVGLNGYNNSYISAKLWNSGTNSHVGKGYYAGMMSLKSVEETAFDNATRTDGTSRTPLNKTGDVAAFCIDLRDTVGWSGNTYSTVALNEAPSAGNSGGFDQSAMGVLKADAMKRLWTHAFASVAGPLTTTNSTAFQIALHEILYEDAPTLAAGEYAKSSGVSLNWNVASSDNAAGTTKGKYYVTNQSLAVNQANLWLNAISTSMTKAALAALLAPDDQGATPDSLQDLVYETRPGGEVIVPEPTTLAGLLGLGLMGGLGLARRRRES